MKYFISLMFVSTLYEIIRLPPIVPTHWNILMYRSGASLNIMAACQHFVSAFQSKWPVSAGRRRKAVTKPLELGLLNKIRNAIGFRGGRWTLDDGHWAVVVTAKHQ